MRLSVLTRGVALSGALTLSLASVALAAGASSTTGENTPLHISPTGTAHAAASSGGSGIVRTIIALAVVIGIIYAVARILKAIKGRDEVRASGNGLTQLATLPLGAGRSVALVRAGSDIVLVGIAEHGVTALKTYTEAEAITSGIEIPAEMQTEYGIGERPFDRVLEGLRRMTVRP